MSLQDWDQRHCDADPNAAPDPLVVETARGMKPGRALDLACGTGRNAVWLAENGWKVTAVDGSRIAIGILDSRDLKIETRVADLERGQYVIEAESWDLILMCRYLQRDLFEPAKAGVVAGGVIIAMVLVSEKELRYRARPGELAHYFEGWEILQARENALAEIAARKPPNRDPLNATD